MQPYPLIRRAMAELLGTYALVTAGCGAIIVNTQTGALTHVGVALTFGLIIAVMIAATGHISGAHFNPAVTMAFALIRRFRWREVAVYLRMAGLRDTWPLSRSAPRSHWMPCGVGRLAVPR